MPTYYKPYISLTLICLLIISCNKQENFNNYKVVKKDFVNHITVYGYLEAAKSQSITTPRVESRITVYSIIEEGSYIQAGDTICILEATEIENDFISSVKDLEIAKAEYNKTRENLNLKYLLLKSQAKTIETTTAIKKLDSIQKAFVSDIDRQIIELELKKSEIQRQKIYLELKFLKKINESELRKTKLKIEQVENKMNRTREMLQKLVITSPNEGLVQLGRNWSTGNKIAEGDPVWSNMPLINLPDLSTLQVRMVVNETHYKKINPGQEVLITVDAHPDLSCIGKVKRKAPAGKPIQRGSKVKVYDVFVSIDSTDFNVAPGLSVTCDVILDRVNDTLIVPLSAIFEEDTNSYVILKQNDKPVKQLVNLSNRSEIEAIVVDGLDENDIISINYSSTVK